MLEKSASVQEYFTRQMLCRHYILIIFLYGHLDE